MSDTGNQLTVHPEALLKANYELVHGTEVMTLSVPDYAIQLKASGIGRFSLYWTTEASGDDVIEDIFRAGREIKGTRYGCAHDHGMTWMTREPTTTADAENSYFHLSMLSGLLQSCGVAQDHSFDELAVSTEGYDHVVSWTRAFNDSDYATNQYGIKAEYPKVRLTDEWIRNFIGATATESLREDVGAVTAILEDYYEREALILALRAVRLGVF